MLRGSRLLATLAVGAGLVLPACGGDDGGSVADDRAAQVRDTALEAGLSAEAADVLALAARGATATFQIAYAGAGGSRLVVSQVPPDRRIDILDGDTVVQSQVVRDGTSYLCDRSDRRAELVCDRGASDLPAPGAFTPEALETFADALAEGGDAIVLTVEERTIADTEARCLVSAPAPGTPLDAGAPGVDTLCLSPDGAQLLVDSEGERVVAESYSTEVPDGTFDV